MKTFTWTLLIGAIAFTLFAAFSQLANQSWLAVLFSCLSGGAFSALFSLIMGRMNLIHQMVFEALAKVKDTNPLTPELGKEIQIKREILTDLGVDEASDVIAKGLARAKLACDMRKGHGNGADPLYPILQISTFRTAVQSLLLPKYPHS